MVSAIIIPILQMGMLRPRESLRGFPGLVGSKQLGEFESSFCVGGTCKVNLQLCPVTVLVRDTTRKRS